MYIHTYIPGRGDPCAIVYLYNLEMQCLGLKASNVHKCRMQASEYAYIYYIYVIYIYAYVMCICT